MSKHSYEPENNMEDISSTSEDYRAKQNPLDTYGNNMLNNLGNIIKVIAFVLGFGIIALSLVLAFFMVSKSLLSLFVSLVVIIIGAVIGAVLFFPVYGIGHIIHQNEEILKKK